MSISLQLVEVTLLQTDYKTCKTTSMQIFHKEHQSPTFWSFLKLLQNPSWHAKNVKSFDLNNFVASRIQFQLLLSKFERRTKWKKVDNCLRITFIFYISYRTQEFLSMAPKVKHKGTAPSTWVRLLLSFMSGGSTIKLTTDLMCSKCW